MRPKGIYAYILILIGVVLAPPVRDFNFSKHYREDKDIDVDLSIDCVNTGRKTPDGEPNKFKSSKRYRRGELIVVYKDFGDYVFVITAYWNNRGRKNDA